jgi:hypothetical protein
MAKAELRVIPAEPPGEDVIEKLELALERARKGELSSVAIVGVTREGLTWSAWSAIPSLSTLVGAVVRLQHDLLRDDD